MRLPLESRGMKWSEPLLLRYFPPVDQEVGPKSQTLTPANITRQVPSHQGTIQITTELSHVGAGDRVNWPSSRWGRGNKESQLKRVKFWRPDFHKIPRRKQRGIINCRQGIQWTPWPHNVAELAGRPAKSLDLAPSNSSHSQVKEPRNPADCIIEVIGMATKI